MSAWIVHTLVSSTLLMLGVLALRRPIARAFGARAAYALWALPGLRMVLPPLPGFHQLYVPVLRVPGAAGADTIVGLVPVSDGAHALVLPPELTAALDATATPAAPGIDWTLWLAGAWLVGAALWFGWQMLRYRYFVRRALEDGVPLATEAGVRIVMSGHVGGPVAAGVIRRRIFLPRDFLTRYDSAERRQALLHEGAHHDRHDLLANLFALAVLALHWWNPIAHLAHRAFRVDQELACDATVLAEADASDLYAYGRALVKSSCSRTPAAACALDRATEIKRRLTMIKRGPTALLRRLAGLSIALLAIGAGLIATASATSATVQERPVPPSPPAIPAPPPALPVTRPAIPATPPAAPVTPPAIPAPPSAIPLPPPAQPAVPIAPLAPIARWHSDNWEGAEARHAAAAAMRAQRDAMAAQRGAALARRDAMRAAAEARRASMSGAEIAALTQRSLAAARASLVAQCAARGTPVRAGEQDWSALAMCDKARFRAEIRNALTQARAAIDRDTGLDPANAAIARDAIDHAMAGMERPAR